MRSLALCLLIGFLVGACSSSSDDGGNIAGTPAVDPSLNVRLATMITEIDGTPQFLFEYDYDSLGRIDTITRINLDTMDETSITTHTYGPDGIVSRSNAFETETFFYENGRISRIESDASFGENFSYTYDNSGRLSNVVGDGFFLDGDCIVVTPAGSEPVLPTYQITYSDDRLTNITGSEGDITNLAYDAQGMLATLDTVADCGEFTMASVTFGYDAEGRPVTASTAFVDGSSFPGEETEELVASYSGGLLSTVEITSTGSSFAGASFTEITTTSYSYDAQGLLTMAVVEIDEESGNELINLASINLAFTYEEGRCAGQQTAYPHRALFLDLQPNFQPSDGDAALACVFSIDNF